MSENFSVTYKTKTALKVQSAVFRSMKDDVLGKEYELSLVFVGEKLGRTLNFQYRQKDYATDILSFPVGKNFGEIFICPKALMVKAKEFGRTPSNYLRFLFIHGLFHLKGLDHGAIMERQEANIRKKYNV